MTCIIEVIEDYNWLLIKGMENKFLLMHLDEDVVAGKLREKVRVLCWIMTAPQNHRKKAIHVKATWGKRCNTLLFMSSAEGNVQKFIFTNLCRVNSI